MTKNEFLSKLEAGLRKNGVADTADILSEYEQHFSYKLADGFSEEEITARLGDPAAIAAQYEPGAPGESALRRITTGIGVFFTDLLAGIVLIFLCAWEAVVAAVALSGLGIAVCLVGGLNISSLIPAMPYGCAVVFAVFFLALAVLSAIGCIYFASFIRQLVRAYGRLRSNALASAAGRACLPPLSISPQFSAEKKRRLRTVALVALIVLAVSFILAFVVSALAAGSVQFWHVWHWFGYRG